MNPEGVQFGITEGDQFGSRAVKPRNVPAARDPRSESTITEGDQLTSPLRALVFAFRGLPMLVWACLAALFSGSIKFSVRK